MPLLNVHMMIDFIDRLIIQQEIVHVTEYKIWNFQIHGNKTLSDKTNSTFN